MNMLSHRADIESRLLEWFASHLQGEIPAVDTDLVESGLLDSLRFVDLLLFLERDFGIPVSSDLELDNFRTIQGIGQFIARFRVLEGRAQPMFSDSRSDPSSLTA